MDKTSNFMLRKNHTNRWSRKLSFEHLEARTLLAGTQLPLDEGSGTVAVDVSGMGNDGALTGGALFEANSGDGSSYSVRLDGVNDSIDLGGLDVNGTELTITAWFKADSFVGAYRDGRIVSKATGVQTQDHYWMLSTIRQGSETRLRFRLRTDGTTHMLIASSGNISTDQWYHAAAVYDGSSMRLYLDGVEVGSRGKAGALDVNPAVNARIGLNPDNFGPFDGLIDDVRILERALTANEIAAIANGVNDAPVLLDTVVTLDDISENAGAPAGAVGTLVSDIVDLVQVDGGRDNINDVDSGAVAGLAITAADIANGSWHYTTNGGTDWNELGAVAGDNARLLAADAATRIYFQPTANYNGTVTDAITFRAWDQTTGVNGGQADSTTSGGTTAFSTATDTASLIVTPDADAPTVQTLSPADDATGVAAGANLVATFSETVVAGTGNITIRLTSNDSLVEQHVVGSAEAAVAGATLTINPTADLASSTGYYVEIDATAIEDTSSNPFAGISDKTTWNFTTADIVEGAPTSDDFQSDGVLNPIWTFIDPLGDATAVLTGQGTADARLEISVPAGTNHDAWDVNTTPRITQPADDKDFELEVKFDSSLTQTYQGQGIIVQQDSDNYLRFDLNYKSGIFAYAGSIRNPSAPQTKVFTTITVATPMYLRVKREGNQWTMSYGDDGTNWTVAGSFAEAMTVTEVGVFASNFKDGPNPTPAHTALVDYFFETSAPVIPEDPTINMAPVLDDTVVVALNNVAQDAGPPAGGAGTLISTIADLMQVTGGLDNISDPDSGAVAGLAITAADTTNGSWYYTTDGGNNWIGLGNVAANNARLLAANADTRIYFQPIATYNGTVDAAVTFRAWDQTSGVNGDLTDPGAGGGTTAFSTGTDTASIVVELPGPAIDVWYGTDQAFGQIGIPQVWANILGNVSDVDGVASLSYSLNGGPDISLSMGPDARRLQSTGDFNVDIAVDDLVDGQNQIVITATDTLSNISSEMVSLDYSGGNVWPIPYTVDWNTVTDIQNIAQVVDGDWEVTGDTVTAPAISGYDRLLAIGDLSWTDYEVSVPVTITASDFSSHFCSCNAIGFVLRWQGHVVNGSQPSWGVTNYGALSLYRWDGSGSPHSERLWMASKTYLSIVEDTSGKTLLPGLTYIFKARAETTPSPGGSLYSFKVWREGDPEPASWDLTMQATGAEDNPMGSILLLSHHTNATFGQVTVTPLASSATSSSLATLVPTTDTPLASPLATSSSSGVLQRSTTPLRYDFPTLVDKVMTDNGLFTRAEFLQRQANGLSDFGFVRSFEPNGRSQTDIASLVDAVMAQSGSLGKGQSLDKPVNEWYDYGMVRSIESINRAHVDMALLVDTSKADNTTEGAGVAKEQQYLSHDESLGDLDGPRGRLLPDIESLPYSVTGNGRWRAEGESLEHEVDLWHDKRLGE